MSILTLTKYYEQYSFVHCTRKLKMGSIHSNKGNGAIHGIKIFILSCSKYLVMSVCNRNAIWQPPLLLKHIKRIQNNRKQSQKFLIKTNEAQ